MLFSLLSSHDVIMVELVARAKAEHMAVSRWALLLLNVDVESYSREFVAFSVLKVLPSSTSHGPFC